MKKTSAMGILVFLLAIIGVTVFFSLYRTNFRSKAATNSGFVTRVGNKLFLNGQQFRFAGANIYWLGLDENVGGVDYPTNQRITDVFNDASSMGLTVVRSHTLGISAGCPKCLEPSLNQFNDQIFSSIDFAIKTASAHNIKLIIPLIDQWYFYHGGKHNFTDWRGLSNPNITNDPNTNAFHTDPTVINDFKTAINHLLTHVNQYTGVALKDDPTIMAWETGNELFTWTTATQSGSALWSEQWTQDIATYVKSLAPNQLVVDGRVANESNPFTQSQYMSSLQDPATDMMTIHQYPPTISTLVPSINAASIASKAVYVGEYDWTGAHGGDPLASFLTVIENSAASGDIFWDLFPTYENHNDGYTLHYPGDNPSMQAAVQTIMADANVMSSNQPVPTPTVEIIPTPTYIPTGTNLLQNPSFESASGTGQSLLTPWWLAINIGGGGTVSQDSTTKTDGITSARVDITQTDADWKVQLFQHTSIQSGQTYTISFWAKASSPRQVRFDLQQAASPNAIHFEQTVQLATTWQQYVLTYPATVTDSDVLVLFNVAASVGTVWLDNTFLTVAPTATPTPSPTTTSLLLDIKLHGLGDGGDNANKTSVGNLTPVHMTRTVSVTLYNVNNVKVATTPVSGQLMYQANASVGQRDFVGTVALPATLPTGVYTMQVSTPGFLSKTLPTILNITQGAQTVVPTAFVVTGDINSDNTIDLRDYNALLSAYGTVISSSTPLPTADLNDDGVVDLKDINLLLREFSVQNGF